MAEHSEDDLADATGVEATDADPRPADAAPNSRGRLTTIFGWVAGAALGLLINFALFRLIGDGYPTTVTTFVLVVLGAFGGMSLSDRLGERGFKPLGIAAGVLLALILAVVAAFFMSPPNS